MQVMRNVVVGFFLGAVLALLAASGMGSRPAAYGQLGDRARSNGSGSEWISFSWDAGNAEQVAVLDPQSRSMSIYEINRNSGAITLKSVRNVGWDLRLEEFNSTNPTPREIRALVERR
jgi:hypothetical protein